MMELVEVLQKVILNNRGAIYEGDVFSVLQHSPYVVRSFEFAVADGCISCDQEFDPSTNFADRLWEAIRNARSQEGKPHRLVLFDIKSTVSETAGDQVYITTHRQRQLVAVFINICAADTKFVDLIPNRYQGVAGQAGQEHVAINTSRESKLPSQAYHLDPSTAPYRMPVHMLPEAIRRIRLCAMGHGDYVNPWTKVPFPGWKPQTVDSVSYLMPLDGSEHSSACRAALEIQRAIKTLQPQRDLVAQRTLATIDMDFVGLQPRLADFKFLLRSLDTNRARQVFIQHKLDVRQRAAKTPLDRVSIARSRSEGDINYWFTPFERLVGS